MYLLQGNRSSTFHNRRFSGVIVGIVAGDMSSLDAAEASIVLKLWSSVLVDEMTVVSEVP